MPLEWFSVGFVWGYQIYVVAGYLDAMEWSFVYVGELARFVYSRSGVINEYFVTGPEGCQVDEQVVMLLLLIRDTRACFALNDLWHHDTPGGASLAAMTPPGCWLGRHDIPRCQLDCRDTPGCQLGR